MIFVVGCEIGCEITFVLVLIINTDDSINTDIDWRQIGHIMNLLLIIGLTIMIYPYPDMLISIL